MQGNFTENNQDNLKISIVAHSSDKGGAERAMLDMIDALLKQNVFVHIILPEAGVLEEELINRGIIYDKADMQWWANTSEDVDSVKKKINANAMGLVGIFNKIKPDIVYTISSVISEGAIAAKILGIPHIWNIAEFGREEHGIKYLLSENERIQFINEYSDKIFFVSEAVKKCYTDKADISEKSSVFAPIISNEANRNVKNSELEHYYKKNVFKMAILGSIAQGKGQEDAILAISEILKKDNDVELVVAGGVSDESYYDELREIIKNNGIQDSVKFIGYIDDTVQLVKQSDIVLVCSVFEGFGRVAAEAMLHKKPVIGANSGATPELIRNGENGFLYEPGHFKELAEGIGFFMNNKSRIIEFGEKGYNFAKAKFNADIYSERLLSELNKLKGKKQNISAEILDMFFEAAILNNEKIQKLKEELKQKDELLAGIVNSLRWKIPNYLYKKCKNIFRR